MYVETMLKAMRYHLYSAGLTFGPDFDRSEIHIIRSYSIQNGIMRRYVRLQQENAQLSAVMMGMNGDFIATMQRNRACNIEYENRIAALQAENADLQHEINVLRAIMTPEHKDIDAVLVEIQAENARLRDEVAFWKAEALKDGGDE